MEEVNKLGKILIVDDKSVNRYILSGIFENEYDMIGNVSLSDNRGCKRRKTAGEESPSFLGQSAG